MYKILKIGYKLPEYKGGKVPIYNINGIEKTMEVSDICNIPRLYKVIYWIKTTMEVYISLFI